MKARIPALDLLRAVAILLVLGRHILIIPQSIPSAVRSFFLIWKEVGWIGVDLFFVLSGFLVSGLLLKEYKKTKTIRIGRFLVRRGLKIYPSFYVFLAASIVTSAFWSLPQPPSERAFLGEALFLQNYVGSLWNHTWSLAIEEHFYLLLAAIMAILFRIRTAKEDPFNFLPKLIGATACVLLVLRIIISSRFPAGHLETTMPFTHLRVDSLFFGVLLSYFYHFYFNALAIQIKKFCRIIVVLGAVAFLLPILYPLHASKVMYSYGFTVLYVAFGGILLLSLMSPVSEKLLKLRPMQVLCDVGQQSYSIYLWHMMIYKISACACPPSSSSSAFFIHTALYVSGSIVLGSFIARAIEFPVLRFRDKYFPT